MPRSSLRVPLVLLVALLVLPACSIQRSFGVSADGTVECAHDSDLSKHMQHLPFPIQASESGDAVSQDAALKNVVKARKDLAKEAIAVCRELLELD